MPTLFPRGRQKLQDIDLKILNRSQQQMQLSDNYLSYFKNLIAQQAEVIAALEEKEQQEAKKLADADAALQAAQNKLFELQNIFAEMKAQESKSKEDLAAAKENWEAKKNELKAADENPELLANVAGAFQPIKAGYQARRERDQANKNLAGIRDQKTEFDKFKKTVMSGNESPGQTETKIEYAAPDIGALAPDDPWARLMAFNPQKDKKEVKQESGVPVHARMQDPAQKYAKTHQQNLQEMRNFFRKEVLIPFMDKKREQFVFGPSVDPYKIVQAKQYYIGIILQYLDEKMKNKNVPETDRKDILARLAKLLPMALSSDKTQRQEYFNELTDFLKNLLEKEQLDSGNQYLKVLELVNILNQHEKFTSLQEALIEFRAKEKKFWQFKKDPTSLHALMPDVQSPKEHKDDGEYKKYQERLKKADEIMREIMAPVRKQKREEKREFAEAGGDYTAGQNVELSAMLEEALSGNEDLTRLRNKLDVYVETGFFTQQDADDILKIVQALGQNAQLNSQQKEHLAQLDRVLANPNGRGARGLIEELKHFAYMGGGREGSLQVDVQKAANALAEDKIMAQVKALEREEDKAKKDLQALEQEAKNMPAAIARQNDLVAEQVRVVNAKQAELQAQANKLAEAQKKTNEARQKPKKQESFLAKMFAYQLLHAVKIYLERRAEHKKWWDLPYHLHHGKKGIKTAKELASKLAALLAKPELTFQDVHQLGWPMLNDSKLHNNSLGTIALEVLNNQGTPPGLFKLNMGNGNQPVENWDGCPDPELYYKSIPARAGLGQRLENFELQPTVEERYSGTIQGLVHKKSDTNAHRVQIRAAAAKNLNDLVDVFKPLHPQQEVVGRMERRME